MKLIEYLNSNEKQFFIYDGIDFDMIQKYSGVDYHIFLVESWIDEVKKWRRDNKIKSILTQNNVDFDPYQISNSFISIYQTNGDLDLIYDTIRKKIIDGYITQNI